MIKKILKTALVITSFVAFLVISQKDVRADENIAKYGLLEDYTVKELKYKIKIQKDDVVALKDKDVNSEVVRNIEAKEILDILEIIEDRWLKVELEDSVIAYIDNSNSVGNIFEEIVERLDNQTQLRQNIVDLALEYDGGRYIWGGTDPRVGADCSGFTRYIFKNTVGRELPHSSVAQSRLGKEINIDELKAGDLVFYSNKRIDHVAIYIGDGKVISASSNKTGIKIAPYDYRKPVKAISLFN